MAKIMTVDYEAIPAQAKQIRTEGQSLNKEIKTAYSSITEMHSNWYGKRYNELVKAFNNIVPQINEMLQLVVGEIPYALETVANNYSQADKGANVTSAANTNPDKIGNISLSNDVGLRFITSSVETTKSKVSTNFNNAKSKMNTIESTYNKITWQSEAADAFKAKFTKLKTEIVNAFDEIDTQFNQLMTQALNDVQSAETANTVQ